MGNTANIVVGINNDSTLRVAPYGAPESQSVDAGFIKGGVTIEHSETRREIKVDQALGTVDVVPTDESMKIKLSLSEATLGNIALAFGYADSAAAGGSFSFGSKSSVPCRTLYINVKGPGGAARKYTFWKCAPTGKTSQAYKRDNETVVDVEFDALCDLSQPAACRFGQIADSGADTAAPSVAMSAPVSGGTLGAGTKTPVVLAVTEAGALDESSIRYGGDDDATVLALRGSAPAVLVAASLVYDRALKTIAITPADNWAAGAYQVVVTTGLRDASGNRLAQPYLGNFTAA